MTHQITFRTATATAAVAFAALAAGPTAALSHELEGEPVSTSTKLMSWDADAGIGVFKHKEHGFIVIRVGAESKIRVDKPVPAGKWRFLSQYGEGEVWCFAEKDYYQDASRTVGVLKPRVIVATGYAIDPLPDGERRVQGALHGVLGWHHGTDVDWKGPGTAQIEGGGLFDLGLNPRELVLVGVPGDRDDVKKSKGIHILGTLTEETMPLTKGGRLLEGKRLETHVGTKIDAPVLDVERLVVLNKAFKDVYQFCFEETFLEGVSE